MGQGWGEEEKEEIKKATFPTLLTVIVGYDLRDNCPEMLIFLQVGLVLSEYPDKSHDFRNVIFMTSHFRTLYRCLQAENNGLEILFYNF